MNLALVTTTHRPVTIGHDADVADRLRAYIRDAEDGVRRIAIAGAYCEWIVQQIPHGKLGDWLQQHAPDITDRCVRQWRAFTRALLDAAKRKHVSAISLPPHELLAAKLEDLSDTDRTVRQEIDAILAGKTYRQLWFEFKQMAEDEEGNFRVTRGCVKGDVRTPHRKKPTIEQEIETRRQAVTVLLQDAVAYMEALIANPDLGLVIDRELCQRAHQAGNQWTAHFRHVVAAGRRNAA